MNNTDEIIRILFVEDAEADVELARLQLLRDGLRFTWKRVATEIHLQLALTRFRPHVVLCDYMLPGFSGPAALKIIRQTSPMIPCLFVSGAISDEIAIRSLEEGLTDYLLKSNLCRLGTAVRRALSDARERARSLVVDAEFQRLSHYDTITGLPNLTLINGIACRAMQRAKDCGRVMAVVTVNLDAFRLVEEGFGRAIGDDVLRSVSDAVTAAVKDPAAVARVGSDEFLVILSDLSQPIDAAATVRQILDAVAAPLNIAGQDLRITASAGIAVYPDDGSDFETLLQRSSTAMHETEVRSRGQMQFYSQDLTQRAQHRVRLESGLRRAMQNRELTLHYQPQFEIRGGFACGVEALLRWKLPGGEAIPPSTFIPLAEQTGMIAALGAWALEEACRTVVTWREPGELPPTLCVNVSTQQISREFTAHLVKVLEITGFPAGSLELEITESVLLENAELTIGCIAAWKRLGIRVAVDDFGTGYSSLSYLSQLPVDRLKLDKSLVHSITADPRDAAIVRAVISLGRELGFTVLAEGVETEAQFEMLADLGCQQVQGFLTARPAPAVEALVLLRRNWGQRAVRSRYPQREVLEANHAF